MKTAEVRRLIAAAKADAKKAYANTSENEVAAWIEDCIFKLESIQHGIRRGESIYADKPGEDIAPASGHTKNKSRAPRRPDRPQQPDLFS